MADKYDIAASVSPSVSPNAHLPSPKRLRAAELAAAKHELFSQVRVCQQCHCDILSGRLPVPLGVRPRVPNSAVAKAASSKDKHSNKAKDVPPSPEFEPLVKPDEQEHEQQQQEQQLGSPANPSVPEELVRRKQHTKRLQTRSLAGGAIAGAVVGAVAGAVLFGPVGLVAGGASGAVLAGGAAGLAATKYAHAPPSKCTVCACKISSKTPGALPYECRSCWRWCCPSCVPHVIDLNAMAAATHRIYAGENPAAVAAAYTATTTTSGTAADLLYASPPPPFDDHTALHDLPPSYHDIARESSFEHHESAAPNTVH